VGPGPLSGSYLAHAESLAEIGTYSIDLSKRTIRISARMAQLLRLDGPVEMPLETYRSRFYFPGDRAATQAKADKAYAEDGPVQVEARIVRADGKVIWVRAASSCERLDDGKPLIVGVIQDVTRERAAEEAEERARQALAASEARFRSYFSSPAIGMAITTLGKGFDEVNDRLCEILGYPREELLRANWSDLTHPEDLAIDVSQFERLLAGEIDDYTLDKRFVRKNGDVIWATIAVRGVRRADATIDYICATVEDITARHDAEQRLRESEERFRQFAENIDAVFWMMDPVHHRTLYVSPAFEKIWGRSRETVRASPEGWLEAVHADDRERVRQAIAVKPARGDYDETYRIVRPDGSVRWIHDRAVPLRDARGEIFRVVGTAWDVTEQRNTELMLEQAQKMEAIGVLAGGVAHDFNNILSAILSYCELLLENVDARDPMHADLEEIRHAGERGANLTRQLLAFSRKQVMAPRVVDLNAILAGMDKMLHRLMSEDIHVVFSPLPETALVYVDPGQIEQVLLNLAVNARDAMPGGGTLTIRTVLGAVGDSEAATMGVKAGAYVELSVADTGEGMDQATQARIFEPFFTTKPEGRGTGLGLSTVFGIVRQSGGFIVVESERGKGATFRISLPLASEADVPAIAPFVHSVVGDGGATLLVVEDDERVRKLTCSILTRKGYEVLEAQSGGDALVICERHAGTIDLVITDVIMPLMRGDELVPRLTKLRPELRAVYMSGYVGANGTAALPSAAGFLQKPFTPDLLLRTVRSALAGGGAPSSIRSAS